MSDTFMMHPKWVPVGPRTYDVHAAALVTSVGMDASSVTFDNGQVAATIFMPYPVAEAVARAFTEATAALAEKAVA